MSFLDWMDEVAEGGKRRPARSIIKRSGSGSGSRSALDEMTVSAMATVLLRSSVIPTDVSSI